MKASDLIYKLAVTMANEGDLEVFVNGEYGVNDPKRLEHSYFSVGAANLSFDTDNLDGVEDSDVVIHIGGY